MNTTGLEARVHDFLAQHRIAVVGVSRDSRRHPAGNLIYGRLKRAGREVFPVNPVMETFEGDRCYPDLRSIPGGVDGAVIITRPDVTERVVQDAEASGVRRVWIHESLAHGSSVSPRAIDYCRAHGMSVIAGACPMMFRMDGVAPDLGHTCMRWIMGFTGRLPA
jgi:predicted CoA-binding protein